MGLILTLETIKPALQQARSAGLTLVATNGCFDILHAGHVHYLQAARRQGDLLIVGVNSDASVRQLKGPTRPINTTDDRMAVLAALACVDLVCSFEDTTADAFLKAVKPGIYVKGGEYESGKVLPESETLKTLGIQAVYVPMLTGRSSTRAINAMQVS
ncbi:MAG: adenylyltransferase/cytidyltransferase family protein [Vampirovibrionales bacterium]|nr:adenylyltransferase/cytidyltransferase family protein [Vampirovibrionales bacterium]